MGVRGQQTTGRAALAWIPSPHYSFNSSMLSCCVRSQVTHVRPLCRPLSSSASRSPLPPRAYLHTVDHLGQVFLADTKIRNFTSNIKEASFLDFFYKRLRPNEGDALGPDAAGLRAEGYSFVSPCGPEMNFVRPDITPLVFQKLTENGESRRGDRERS